MKLYGKNPVIERLRTNPKSVKKVYIENGYKESSLIHRAANQAGVPVFYVPPTRLAKLGRNPQTHGVLVDIEDFAYIEYGDLVSEVLAEGKILVFLDNLNDPQNLGAIIRSLGCFGRFAIVLPTHNSVSVTEAVLRVSSGGDNYVKIAQVSNLNNAIRKAKEEGFWIAGAVVSGGEELSKVKFNFPLGLVVGSEQKGIREIIEKNIDIKITIPMAAKSLSFNVAHATTIFAYEILRQKNG